MASSNSQSVQQLIRLLLRQKSPWAKIGIGVVILAVLAMSIDLDGLFSGGETDRVTESTPASKPAVTQSQAKSQEPGAILTSSSSQKSDPQQVNGYYKFEDATLHEDRGNDGDSFLVDIGDHEPVHFRLYFIDCPEKYYDTNVRGQAKRVEEQAEEFGVSVERTVEIGKEAREWVLDLLAKQSFTIYTAWAEVYDSGRFHAFVEVKDPESGKRVYLTELLVRKGYGRIHTWGEDTPDGQHWREYKDELRRLESIARKNGEGVWSR